jgi:hypothetical protein
VAANSAGLAAARSYRYEDAVRVFNLARSPFRVDLITIQQKSASRTHQWVVAPSTCPLVQEGQVSVGWPFSPLQASSMSGASDLTYGWQDFCLDNRHVDAFSGSRRGSGSGARPYRVLQRSS